MKRLHIALITAVVLVGVGVAGVVVLTRPDADPPRLTEIEKIAGDVHGCPASPGVRSRETPNPGIRAWAGVRHRKAISCGPPDYLDPMLAWVQFDTPTDRQRAMRTRAGADRPVCFTATEAFFVYFDDEQAVRAFCDRVGASRPLGQPVT